ncbi:TfuA-like core domain-containing protein [Streptomyces sp. 5-8]|uniref:TfuA-like core domain-containing protein n=1 Tax=Streptomyces musisoli TaxID=2802280 RepID=A0ABS1PBJ0_9ACTN|nr:TfuA-like protein [Streptomyces musisoli]MBL1109417.1 TfuA-like core domain-containing protein [Streptomyces musisoli]
MIHIFTGPTLSPDDFALQGADLRVWPPIGHGHMFNSAIRAGDTVVIIDGVYHQAPAVRHKEIIWALGRGVRVIGAASIGALRAAELGDCGMLGVGSVWQAYATGALAGDDEVAVAQSTEGDLRACTWPLVRVRQVAAMAVCQGVLEQAEADQFISVLAGVYYAHRSWDAVRLVSWREAPAFTQWLADRLAEDRHFGDVKRVDALSAVALARDLATTPVEPVDGLHWGTRCFRQWANRHAAQDTEHGRLRTLARVNFQQVFDPQFAEVWWEYLGNHSMQGLPRAVACAVTHPRIDLSDEAAAARLLVRETAADRADVVRYAAINAEMGQVYRGFFPEAIKETLVRDLLAKVWATGPDGLEEEAWLRGLQGAREAVEAARPFVLGFLRDQEAAR